MKPIEMKPFCMHIAGKPSGDMTMATLTIRNLDGETVERLKLHARQNERSLEAEVRHILNNAARSPTHREFWARADAIAAMTPRDIEQTDSVTLLQEDRDR